jgi:hypothetical protein
MSGQPMYRKNLQTMKQMVDAKAKDENLKKIADSIYISIVNTATVGEKRCYIHSVRDMLVEDANKVVTILKLLFPDCIVRYVDYQNIFNGNGFEEIEKSIVVDWS